MDVFCTESSSAAIEYLKSELKSLEEEYYERCEGHCEEGSGCTACGTSECCDWCSVAVDAEVAVSHIADGDAASRVKGGSGLLYQFSPPEGADMSYWLAFAEGDRSDCELNEDD
ncbi:hypothetical protein [Streptomyces decoyicus]